MSVGLERLLLLLVPVVQGHRLLRPSEVQESGIPFSGVYHCTDRGDMAEVNATEYDNINYFCYQGQDPSITLFWASASFKLDLGSPDYEVYIGPNLTSVHHLHQQAESSWIYTQLPWRTKEFKISPFQNTCVGVKTTHQYRMSLQIKKINYFMFLLTCTGTIIFFMAPRLCRNQFFHFATGISAGVLLSVLILTYLIQRKLRVPWLSWIGLLYSLSLYFITSTWYNFKEYLTEQYFHWLVGYFLGAGLLSFAIIYRLGAPSNPRTINLIQWTMQAVSLVCVVLSSYHQVASLSLALLLLTWSLVPAATKSWAQTRFRRTFLRPRVKLLTEEEYINQANEETRKELEKLRNFCQSPESKPWSMVSRLRSPGRFAEFIEGSPHITEDEVMAYSHWDETNETDDEDSRDSLTDDENGVGDRSFDGQTDH